MDQEGFGCETLERENHDAESSCGKIRGEFGIRVCTTVRERQGSKKGILPCFREIISDIDVGERLLICGDMNGQVGAEVDGFEGVHSGYGFGRRNVDGEMLLEFADALDFAIVNILGSRRR